MALRVWLPLNGNYKNQGLSSVNPAFTINDTVWTHGKIGDNLLLENKTTGYVTIPELNGTKNLTCCFWVKFSPNQTYTTWSDVCSLGIAKNGSEGLYRLENGDTVGRWKNWYGNGYVTDSQGTGDFNAELGKWYHIASIINNDNGYIYNYVDGIQISSKSLSTYKDNFWFTGTFRLGDTGSYVTLADFRIYDECLSTKQIKEIAKGLVCNYKLDNPYIAGVTNLAPGINNRTIIGINNAPTWDKTLNGDILYNPTNWSNGYNTGVTDARHGYHAHWVFEDGKWIMMFPNLNSVINQKGRWLGIYGDTSGAANILAGEKYTISWWQKTDNLNLAAHGGIYYKKTSSGTANFWDGHRTLGYNTKLNTWQFMSKIYTRSSDYVQHDAGGSIYVYGDNTTYEGTVYVKDVQVQKGEYTSPYTVGTQSLIEITDNSGYGYTATKSGTLTFNTDSPRYGGSTIFNNGYLHYLPSPLNTNSDAFTYTCWFYPTRSGTMCLYNDRTATGTGFAVFYLSGGIRFDTGGASNFQSGSITVNDWNFIACVYDKNNTIKKTYINGVETGSTSTLGNLDQIGTNASIGNSSTNGSAGAGNQVYGSISDVRIYCTALSADDILTLYKTSGIIDNEGNVYSYEFVEE